MTLLRGEYDIYGWKTPLGRSQVFGDVDQIWIDLHSARSEAIVEMRRSDFQRSAPSYLDIGALLRLICARGDTTSLQDLDCKVQFNPNLLFWLGCTLEHPLLRTCAIELQRHGIGSEAAHTVMINARAAAQHIRRLSVST